MYQYTCTNKCIAQVITVLLLTWYQWIWAGWKLLTVGGLRCRTWESCRVGEPAPKSPLQQEELVWGEEKSDYQHNLVRHHNYKEARLFETTEKVYVSTKLLVCSLHEVPQHSSTENKQYFSAMLITHKLSNQCQEWTLSDWRYRMVHTSWWLYHMLWWRLQHSSHSPKCQHVLKWRICSWFQE